MSGAGKAIKKGFKSLGNKVGINKIGRELKKGFKKVTENALDISTAGTYSAAKKGFQKVGEMLTPEVPDIIIEGDQAAPQSQYVMPDEEELMRARRRRGRTSQSGRSSTILSSDSGSNRLGG